MPPGTTAGARHRPLAQAAPSPVTLAPYTPRGRHAAPPRRGWRSQEGGAEPHRGMVREPARPPSRPPPCPPSARGPDRLPWALLGPQAAEARRHGSPLADALLDARSISTTLAVAWRTFMAPLSHQATLTQSALS